MKKEEFLKIMSLPNSNEINKKVAQYRFHNGMKDLVLYDINTFDNAILSNENGDKNLRSMYDYFTEEEWNELLPDIYYRDFNKDFDKVIKKVLPLFEKIKEYWDDLHLELWQGIFSFESHWAVIGKSPEELINFPENGKLYCDTLLEIYPILKELNDKWDCQPTFYRFIKYQHDEPPILYNPKYESTKHLSR